MKIMIINGSPRKKGATSYILHKIEDTLVKHGAEVVYYDLIEQNIALCNGCCACYRIGHCVIDDNAEKISKELREVDGVVIGSSTIASNVSGLLKTFIDRGHFVIEQLLYGKYALCVATYENYGGNTTAKVLNSLVTLSGASLCGNITEKIPFNSAYSSNEALSRRAEKCAEKLYKSIEQNKQYVFQKIKHKIIIEAGLKPFIKRKGDAYASIQQRWKALNIL